MLFTHRGISGPAILNASLFWQKGRICINFLPKFSEINLVNGKKQLSSVLPLPKRFVLEFLRNFGLKDRAYYEFSDDEKNIIKRLFAYHFAPAGTFGFERAEVTKGGVKTNFLDENLECKRALLYRRSFRYHRYAWWIQSASSLCKCFKCS